MSSRDLVSGIKDIVAWMSGKEGEDYKAGYMFTYLMNKFGDDENVAKSFALRLLIHYMGDLVQPLHCENRYNSEFTAGDKGGNDFPLKYHYDVDELHALWDKIMYDGYHNIARPFTTDTWDEFQPQVTDTMTNYPPKSSSLWESTDYDTFSQGSYDIAVKVYSGLTPDAAVPQAYLDEYKPIAYQQINLGGYRLYYAINYIFGDVDASQFDR